MTVAKKLSLRGLVNDLDMQRNVSNVFYGSGSAIHLNKNQQREKWREVESGKKYEKNYIKKMEKGGRERIVRKWERKLRDKKREKVERNKNDRILFFLYLYKYDPTPFIF